MANNVYDMMRDKAKAMGHAAAKLPDSAFERYAKLQDNRSNLLQAKLYIENYMMGNLDPSEFAMVMAENTSLRYAISDLCRQRLEPVDLNISRNDSYIDLAAGVKTFWTEIRVPLPSELNAARDIRNINYGIEAGRATSGEVPTKEQSEVKAETTTEEVVSEKGKKHTLREFLSGARQRAAEMAIEKLTPIAEGRKEAVKLDETWLETEEGQEYKNTYTRESAQEIDNTVMNINAGLDQSLAPKERKKAFEAAGIPEDKANEMIGQQFSEEVLETAEDMEDVLTAHDLIYEYSPEELNRPLNDDMQELFDQILQHVDQDRKNGRRRGKDEQSDKQSNNQTDKEAPVPEYPIQDNGFAADYYEQLAREMEGYQDEEFVEYPTPDGEEDVQLSAEECARLFEQGTQQMGL